MMDDLRKLVTVLTGFVIAIVVSVLVMINGWGLEPKSWWWIIGVNFIGLAFAQLLINLGASKGD